MRLLHQTEGMAQPNVCALCNTSPDRNLRRVVDTGYTRIAPRADVVYRNYVCEACGTEIANKLGFISNEQAKAAFHAAQVATEKLDVVRNKVQEAAQEIVDFAKDVTLTNERVIVEKSLEGDYVQPEVKEAPRKAGRPAKSSGTVTVTAG